MSDNLDTNGGVHVAVSRRSLGAFAGMMLALLGVNAVGPFVRGGLADAKPSPAESPLTMTRSEQMFHDLREGQKETRLDVAALTKANTDLIITLNRIADQQGQLLVEMRKEHGP